jgi:hypothetical protein
MLNFFSRVISHYDFKKIGTCFLNFIVFNVKLKFKKRITNILRSQNHSKNSDVDVTSYILNWLYTQIQILTFEES